MPLSLRQRRSVVVFVGPSRLSDRGAVAMADSLEGIGVEIVYLGHESSARRIAASVADARAESVELCVAEGGVVRLLRELLGELRRLDRGQVSIVVHRVQ